MRKTKIKDRLWGGVGQNTDNYQGGFLVQIKNAIDQSFSCGGSYLAPLIVLTSANCVTPFRYQTYASYAITTANLEEEENTHSLVTMIFIPEDFQYMHTTDDLAVVKLNRPLEGLLTEFIGIAKQAPEGNITLSTLGWGHSKMMYQQASEDPLLVNLTHIDYESCLDRLGKNKYFLSETSACALEPKSMYECIYDGGCPVIFEDKLVGIISIGFSCRNTSNPAIYTNLVLLREYLKITIINSYYLSNRVRGKTMNTLMFVKTDNGFKRYKPLKKRRPKKKLRKHAKNSKWEKHQRQ